MLENSPEMNIALGAIEKFFVEAEKLVHEERLRRDRAEAQAVRDRTVRAEGS